MTDFGAFIEIEEGIDGLVHVSDLSWTKRVKHPSEVLKKGQIVQAVILNIDSSSHRLSLGIKQLQPDAWESYFQNHQVGDTVHGRVCRLASFGAFVELAEGVEGLCHFSEVPGYTGRRGHEEPPLAVGQEFDFKIIKMSEAEKKDRAQPARRGGRRGEEPPGRLPAPGGRRHYHHRRSHEPQRPQPRITCKFFVFKRYCGFVS